MKVCFPVAQNKALDSRIYSHFGSAPEFIMVDLATNEMVAVANSDGAQHRGCTAVAALCSYGVEAVVVGGIGAGALSKLNQAGLSVYQAENGTVAENILLLGQGRLAQYRPGNTCGGHGHGEGHGCGHGS